jgi:hypothetical protein
MTATPCQTSWHVVEFASGLENGQVCNVANMAPHMLRWIIEPHAETHHVVAARRRRAPSGASIVRLVMDPRQGNGQPVVVHAVLVTHPPIGEAG